VYAICRDALLRCPNSAPALDTLSLYYVHLAHLAAGQHAACSSAASSGSGGSSSAAAAPVSLEAGSGANAGPMTPQPQAGGNGAAGGTAGALGVCALEGPAVAAAIARLGLVQAAQSVVALLNHLMVADPIRSMFWNHRWGSSRASWWGIYRRGHVLR